MPENDQYHKMQYKWRIFPDKTVDLGGDSIAKSVPQFIHEFMPQLGLKFQLARIQWK